MKKALIIAMDEACGNLFDYNVGLLSPLFPLRVLPLLCNAAAEIGTHVITKWCYLYPLDLLQIICILLYLYPLYLYPIIFVSYCICTLLQSMVLFASFVSVSYTHLTLPTNREV